MSNIENILTVDDEIINSYAIKNNLEKNNNLHIDTALNGQIAYEMYLKNNYDLILMDIKMPILDGIQATIKIREYEKNNSLKKTPIIMISAYENTVCDDIKDLIDGYIQKPFHINCYERINQILNKTL